MTISPPEMKSSTPRLSDRAKVVYPSGIATSGWPEVERQLRRMGIAFDWFQVGISKLALAKRADGTYAATVGGVILSIPRQVGKTYMLCGLLFALCLIFPGFTALWTAQQLRTAKETLRAMQGFARKRSVAPFVAYVRVANGEGEVGLVNGSRILFGARDYGFGLGMADIDALVFDEGQRLSETAVDDMLPTQNRAKNPLFFIVGTPPRPSDNGDVFSRKRKEALSGVADDMVYVEFSADRSKAPRDHIDWDQVALANPSYPDHTPKTAIMRMWKNLGADSFWREGYGIWDADGASRFISEADWAATATTTAPTEGVRAFGVAFSVDGSRVALAGALRHAGGVHVDVIGTFTGSTEAGLAPLADWLAERKAAATEIHIAGPDGQVLMDQLRNRKVPDRVAKVVTTGDYFAACAALVDAVRDSVKSVRADGPATFTHPVATVGDVLDDSVAVCDRKVRASGAWGWEATTADGDETPIEAVSLALRAAKTTKRRPGRVVRGRVL